MGILRIVSGIGTKLLSGRVVSFGSGNHNSHLKTHHLKTYILLLNKK
jgi:hypothetical protein